MTYKEYLQTKYWKRLKILIHKRDKVCKCCGSKKNLQVHHLKYRGFYKEKLKDLVLVCGFCHNWYYHFSVKFFRIAYFILYAILFLSIYLNYTF